FGQSMKQRTLLGHLSPLSAVAFSPDGKLLASCGADQVVKLWDAQTGHEVRSLRGHTDWISAVAFSPDGRTIVTASVDRTVRLWENTNQGMNASYGHSRRVNTVAY